MGTLNTRKTDAELDMEMRDAKKATTRRRSFVIIALIAIGFALLVLFGFPKKAGAQELTDADKAAAAAIAKLDAQQAAMIVTGKPSETKALSVAEAKLRIAQLELEVAKLGAAKAEYQHQIDDASRPTPWPVGVARENNAKVTLVFRQDPDGNAVEMSQPMATHIENLAKEQTKQVVGVAKAQNPRCNFLSCPMAMFEPGFVVGGQALPNYQEQIRRPSRGGASVTSAGEGGVNMFFSTGN